jgi:circadian clock protein KaiB
MTARATMAQHRSKRQFVFRLYVAGTSRNSVVAQKNLRALCAFLPEGSVDLEIVDVFLFPERALADGVLVTPTLIKVSPRPSRTVVGDLSDGPGVSELLRLPVAEAGR